MQKRIKCLNSLKGPRKSGMQLLFVPWPTDVHVADDAKDLTSRLLTKDTKDLLLLENVPEHPFMMRCLKTEDETCPLTAILL